MHTLNNVLLAFEYYREENPNKPRERLIDDFIKWFTDGKNMILLEKTEIERKVSITDAKRFMKILVKKLEDPEYKELFDKLKSDIENL